MVPPPFRAWPMSFCYPGLTNRWHIVLSETALGKSAWQALIAANHLSRGRRGSGGAGDCLFRGGLSCHGTFGSRTTSEGRESDDGEAEGKQIFHWKWGKSGLGRRRMAGTLRPPWRAGYFLSSVVVVVVVFFSMIAGAAGVVTVALRTTTRLATRRSPTLV